MMTTMKTMETTILPQKPKEEPIKIPQDHLIEWWNSDWFQKWLKLARHEPL